MKAIYGKPIWLKSRRMRKDFNPLTDFSLAHHAEQNEIDATFRENPWCKRLDVNGTQITRSDWRIEFTKRKAAQKEKQP